MTFKLKVKLQLTLVQIKEGDFSSEYLVGKVNLMSAWANVVKFILAFASFTWLQSPIGNFTVDCKPKSVVNGTGSQYNH